MSVASPPSDDDDSDDEEYAHTEPREHVEDLVDTLGELPDEIDTAEEQRPLEARDIGDTETRENPRANDLGYVEGAGECAHTHDKTTDYHFLHDSPTLGLSGETYIGIDDEHFVVNTMRRS